MKWLVTGGSGFIGSNLIVYLLENNTDIEIVNLDALTYAANQDNLSEIEADSRYSFVKGDIADTQLIRDLFAKHQFTGVMHLAAESHVDNSIESPAIFIQTNITGTFNLLEAAKNTWLDQSFNIKPGFESARFLHVSTDEVYGSLGKTGLFTEKTAYAPNSPYSASKASSDFLVRSYHETYGLNTVITNCSNNFGPKQHQEKLIPTVIRHALEQKPIPIYGKGENIRDWLFVEDHCDALKKVFDQGVSGETYNVGANQEKTNIELVQHICDILDRLKPRGQQQSYKDLISFVKDRPGHDLRYAIDASKLRHDLGWLAKHNFEQALEKTVVWYCNQYALSLNT